MGYPRPQYVDYTPTVSQNGARTTSSLVARYRQDGKMVHAWGRATVSNAGTAGNEINVSLPVTASADAIGLPIFAGTGSVLDLGTLFMPVLCRLRGSPVTLLGFVKTNADVDAMVGESGPSFALASGDVISWNVVYEAA